MTERPCLFVGFIDRGGYLTGSSGSLLKLLFGGSSTVGKRIVGSAGEFNGLDFFFERQNLIVENFDLIEEILCFCFQALQIFLALFGVHKSLNLVYLARA